MIGDALLPRGVATF